jgi:glutaconate CoA-transferase, subunit A
MREKLISLQEAAESVKSGSALGLTAGYVENAPMAFLRELVRRGTKDLRVVTLPGGGMSIDFLIGAGAVAEYETCFCSLGEHGQAPHFQKALRLHSIKMKDNT